MSQATPSFRFRNNSSGEGVLTASESTRALFERVKRSREVPRACRQAAVRGDAESLAISLARYLATRRRPRTLSQMCPKALSPYFWGLPTETSPSLVANLSISGSKRVGELPSRRVSQSGGAPRLARWLAGSPVGQPAAPPGNTDFLSEKAVWALHLLVQCDRLPHTVGFLSPLEVVQILSQLLAVAERAATTRPASFLGLDEESALLSGTAEWLGDLLWHGELPWTVSVHYPELAVSRRLASAARRAIHQGLKPLADTDGILPSDQCHLLPLLVASLTRCAWLGRQAGRLPWDRRAARHYQSLVVHLFRLRQADQVVDEFFLHKAAELSGQRRLRKLIQARRPRRIVERRRLGTGHGALDSSIHAAGARTAVLRSHWGSQSPAMVIDYRAHPMRCELALPPDRLLAGPWQVELSADGQPLHPVRPMEPVCWVSDDDLIYLELEGEWSGSVEVERQLILGRREPFVFLADTVKAPAAGPIAYTARWGLTDAARGKVDRVSRLGWVSRRQGSRIWFVPLGLEQWRVEHARGSLHLDDRGAQLHVGASGKRLFAPLLLYWGPTRRNQVGWRSLTVTEEQHVMRPEKAVGYRVRLGPDRQWLVYRSLGPRATRAVLGHQTRSEFVLGRFNKKGDVELLIQIV